MSKSEFKRLAVQRGSDTPRVDEWAFMLDDGSGEAVMSDDARQLEREKANAYRLGQERMRTRCAEECDAMAANARPSCERNYTDGDAWVEAAANAIRALPVEE